MDQYGRRGYRSTWCRDEEDLRRAAMMLTQWSEKLVQP